MSSRRSFLRNAAAFAVGGLIAQGGGFGQANGTALVGWQTKNRLLNPFTYDDKILYLSGENTVEAWDLQLGAARWWQKSDAPAAFRPRLAGDLLISGGRTLFNAWQRDNGALRWQFRPQNKLGVPIYRHGRLHFGDGNRLITLDAQSGRELWAFEITQGTQIWYAPAGAGETIYFCGGDGVLFALSSADGSILWQQDRAADWQYLRQIQAVGDVLVSGGYHDELLGIDITDGNIRWRFNAGNFINSQVVHGDAVYYWSPTGWIYAHSISDGKVLWRHRTTDYEKKTRRNWAPVLAELVADERYVYVLTMGNVLHVLSRTHGEEVISKKLPKRVRPFICLKADTRQILFGTNAGEIIQTEI